MRITPPGTKSEPTIGEQSKAVLEREVLEDVFGVYERD
jgi:hypothetical protein